MRSKILRELMDHSDTFVSGQKLCKTFGVSRQAVWKNICCLKELGYDIESVTNKGYRLISKPDILYGPEIEAYLEEESFCQKVECHDSIDSTNIRGKQLAELGEAEGTLIVADRQTAGRGRRGRNWISESGVGIYMTYVLRPTVQPAHVSGITLLAALAMCEATYQECDVLPQIKWPNDVIIDGKKICGILTEMSSEVQYVHYAVMGIGINANKEKFDETLKDKATSIYLSTGKKVNRAKFTAAFADAFGGYYRRYMQDGDLSAFVEEYDELLANKDKEVIIYHGMVEDATPDKISRGIARGIDKDGALLVEIDGSVTPVMSGEVSIRGYRDMSEKEPVVLCAASSYEQKYYLNEAFSGLPTAVKEELQVMCVLYTADVGGILTLQFDEDGNLQFQVTSADDDFLFDEIGSVLKIKQYQADKQELLEALELYYRIKILGEKVDFD